MNKAKKFGMLLLCTALLGGAVGAAAEPANLAENGGFEDNLYYWDWKKVSMERVTDNPHSGEACAKVKIVEPAGRGRYAFFFEQGVTYDISIWTRLEKGTDTAKILISHNELWGLNTNITNTRTSTVGTEWTKLTTSYTFNGDDADMGWAWVSVNWGGSKTTPTHYLDDLSITVAGEAEVTSAIPQKENELASNSGMDRGIEGYTASGVELSHVTTGAYLNTPGCGRVKVTEEGGTIGQSIKLSPGKTYTMTAKVKTDGKAIPFNFLTDCSQSPEIKPEVVVKSAGEGYGKWSEVKASFTFGKNAPETNAVISLQAGYGQKGITYYMDEFSVTESAEAEVSTAPESGGEAKIELSLSADLKKGEVTKNNMYVSTDTIPYLIQGQVMCDGEEYAALLGVPYSQADNTITIGEGENSVELKIGSKIMKKGSIVYPLSAAPTKTDSGADVPLDIIAQCGGLPFSFDAETNIARVN